MITGIAHLACTAKDMEKSLAFYVDGLGFEKAFELEDDQGNPWIIYLKVAPGQFIELFYGGVEGTQPVPKQAGYNHLCLAVDDIQAVARQMEAAGIPLDVPIQQGKDLNHQCWVRDPDGNRIEFMQMHADSPQNKA